MLFTMVWEIPQNSQTPCCEMIQVYCFDTSYIEQASQSGLKKTLWLAKFDGPATTTIGGSMGRDKPPKVIASSDLTFSGHLPLLNRPQSYFLYSVPAQSCVPSNSKPNCLSVATLESAKVVPILTPSSAGSEKTPQWVNASSGITPLELPGLKIHREALFRHRRVNAVQHLEL